MLVVAWANAATSCMLIRAAAATGKPTYEALAEWAGGKPWKVTQAASEVVANSKGNRDRTHIWYSLQSGHTAGLLSQACSKQTTGDVRLSSCLLVTSVLCLPVSAAL